MSRLVAAATAALLLSTTGCLSVSVNTDSNSALRFQGLGTGYLSTDGMAGPERPLLHAGLFNQAERDGEVASFRIGRLFSLGVGVVGARVQVLPFELGLGTLFYDPEPTPPKEPKPRPSEGEDAPACGQECS